MGKAFGEKPSANDLGKGLGICSGVPSGSFCCKGERGSSNGLEPSIRSSLGLLGATGLLRISVADMR